MASEPSKPNLFARTLLESRFTDEQLSTDAWFVIPNVSAKTPSSVKEYCEKITDDSFQSLRTEKIHPFVIAASYMSRLFCFADADVKYEFAFHRLANIQFESDWMTDKGLKIEMENIYHLGEHFKLAGLPFISSSMLGSSESEYFKQLGAFHVGCDDSLYDDLNLDFTQNSMVFVAKRWVAFAVLHQNTAVKSRIAEAYRLWAIAYCKDNSRKTKGRTLVARTFDNLCYIHSHMGVPKTRTSFRINFWCRPTEPPIIVISMGFRDEQADRFLSMLGRAITTSSDYHVIYYFLNSLTTIDAIDAKLSNPDNYKKATEKKDEVFFDMDNVRADYSYAITHIGHARLVNKTRKGDYQLIIPVPTIANFSILIKQESSTNKTLLEFGEYINEKIAGIAGFI